MSAQLARNPTDLESSTLESPAAESLSPLKNGLDKERNDGLTPLG